MKILFIGNSHTYFNDMPEQVARMIAAAVGEKPEVVMLAYSGRELKWHREEYFAVRFALTYGGFDYCVIQQAAHPYPPADETRSGYKWVCDMCHRHGVKPVVFMTWAERDKPENQQKMIDLCEEIARENGALLAPVGRIWERIRRERPDIDLYFEDGGHAGVYGDFLIAAVICKTITGALPPAGYAHAVDFTCGEPLDWDDLRLSEDRERLNIELERGKVEAIVRFINND